MIGDVLGESSERERLHAVTEQSLYEQFGGYETFHRLVEVFYAGVAEDPELKAMYPEADLEPAKRRLEMFLEQYWGGPTTYSQERGHPRLRMRHMPFAVTPEQRDRWLTHMMAACDAVALPPESDAVLRDYLTRAAYSLVNTPGPDANPVPPSYR